MIFVDTSVWYTANVPEDVDHQRSRDLLLSASSDLITTDYVVDELLTLLVVRKHRDIAKRIGEEFCSQKACDLVWTTQDDVLSAWKVFTTFDNKTWGFTDCVSYSIMKHLGIVEAFALDEVFKQFGFASVKP